MFSNGFKVFPEFICNLKSLVDLNTSFNGIWHARGNIKGRQIILQCPSYINALLIQSLGE
jgi:adenylate cyclase